MVILNGFGAVETDPISHLSLLCAAGSDIERASPRGRGTWASATTYTSHCPVQMGRGAGPSASSGSFLLPAVLGLLPQM